MKRCKHKLYIQTNTWNKESNELLDYESPDLSKQELIVDSPGYVSREKDQISFLQRYNLNDTIIPMENTAMYYIDCNKNSFFVNINSSYSQHSMIQAFIVGNNSKEKAWISLRHYQSKKSSEGYRLSPGDLIKLGRMMLKVRDIHIEGKNTNHNCNNSIMNNMNMNNTVNTFQINKTKVHSLKVPSELFISKDMITNTNVNINNNNININSGNNNNRNERKKICRICYSDNSESDSPLINPCKCSGGLKYIHLACLQHWLKSKSILVSLSNDNCTIFTLNQTSCELCKEAFPDFVKVDNNFYQILDFSAIKFKNYISLETAVSNGKKTLYIVSFDKKNLIKIGRSHESDFRISDVTVSRFHGSIMKKDNGSVYISDSNSKFGSLVYLHIKQLQILNDICLPIQIGRSLFINTMIKKFNLCSSCLCNFIKMKGIKLISDYCDMNASEIKVEEILSVKIQNEDENESESDNYIEEKEQIKEKRNNSNLIKEQGRETREVLDYAGNDIRAVDDYNTLNYISGGERERGRESNILGITQRTSFNGIVNVGSNMINNTNIHNNNTRVTIEDI